MAQGKLTPAPEVPVPPIPMDLSAAVAQGLVSECAGCGGRGDLDVMHPSLPQVRVPTHIVSTICDDRGEEPTYNGVTMSELIEGDYGIGDVISLLWFKKQLPKYATKFMEM